jgi:hypothetical protein
MPSNATEPSAGRCTILSVLATPVTRLRVAFVTDSGSMSSYTCPVLVSSPKMTVPHGVTCSGSQDWVPVTIVAAAPVARSIR